MRHPHALAFLIALVPFLLVAAVAARADAGVAIEGNPSTVGEDALPPLDGAGRVELPREVYDRLIDAARPKGDGPRPVPAAYALGNADVLVNATEGDDGAVSAEVTVTLTVEVLDDDWVLVPLLPAGTPVAKVTIDGNAVQLLSSPLGLAWATRDRGAHAVALSYRVDAQRAERGRSLSVPAPAAASIALTARLPGPDLDAAVVPAAGLQSRQRGGRTEITATVPTTRALQILWSTPGGDTHAISRARYAVSLEDDVLALEGALDVEVLTDGAVTLDLLPLTVTLRDVSVDGAPAAILVRDDRFATVVRGRGKHSVRIGFLVPVARGDGPPAATVDIPAVPVSRFDLSLPGRKEVTTAEAASVDARFAGDRTLATVFAPMRRRVTFRWTEAVPDAVRAEVRANAGLYHAAWAEEGVLFVRALVALSISRGETRSVRLTVPAGVQVERVLEIAAAGAAGVVADWRMGAASDGARDLTVYLNRPLAGELVLAVDYDRALGEGGPLPLPLLTAPDTQRQRGMAALLQGRELTLEPVLPAGDAGATRVGENQLPAFVREQLSLPVAHTFKYVEPPVLSVEAVVPERRVGRFDAAIDTLVSLGEVTLEATATVEIDVKSGGIEALQLALPPGVTLLGLTGPSIRNHELSAEDGSATQTIDVAFTQAMEGQFRLEARYERILEAAAEAVAVPTLAVIGAEVEQGRIAVEALSAVEVQAAGTEHLTALDPAELPRQLLLRTSNPILLAYKYVRADPRPALRLAVERHELIGVQEAVIDQARYTTLVTQGGMAVTTARFVVRNSRKQFLRLLLPEGANVWSAFVDGRPEKPALAGGDGDAANEVLIKIKNATDGFAVDLVYEVPGSGVGGLGTLEVTLPQPDILVTDTRWDLYLPAGLRYGHPRTAMELTDAGVPTAPEEMRRSMAVAPDPDNVEPLVIEVPTAGVRYSFAKLYANQRADAPSVRIGYASESGAALGSALSVIGTLLVWLAAGTWLLPPARAFRRPAAVVGALGLALVIAMLGVFHLSAAPVAITSVLALLAAAALFGARWWRARSDAALDF